MDRELDLIELGARVAYRWEEIGDAQGTQQNLGQVGDAGRDDWGRRLVDTGSRRLACHTQLPDRPGLRLPAE
jgi:hypothetical protein